VGGEGDLGGRKNRKKRGTQCCPKWGEGNEETLSLIGYKGG